jgi:hypothetical protein
MTDARGRRRTVTLIENVSLGYIRQKLEASLGVDTGFTINGTDWRSSTYEDGRIVILTIGDWPFKPYPDRHAAYDAWVVEVLGEPRRRAFIEEARTEGGIRLTIRDPADEKSEPIGAPFEEFCRMAIGEGITLREEDRELPASRPEWFPKTEKTRKKWCKSYDRIQEMRANYQDLYENGETDEPNPSVADLQDALATMPEWVKKPDPSTVRRIRMAGDNGWLN